MSLKLIDAEVSREGSKIILSFRRTKEGGREGQRATVTLGVRAAASFFAMGQAAVRDDEDADYTAVFHGDLA